ncbi:ABZJ_00895 family protein [Pseudosulfitobacter koreensis]|uniref:ABZJ_00895 family protein n=1 Tax=Pseudosulfitobacter koreensis TaxID=2968472 RepID=A0ABT1YVP9_9RHOB|nr:ABZJ_00895 family protein [Pseudosulfitobacter koreense]
MDSYRFNIPRFATIYLALSIGLPILLYLIRTYAGINLNSGGVSLIPIMLTTLNEGARFTRATERRPTNREAWKMAGLFALFGVMLSMLLAAVVLVVAPLMLGDLTGLSLGLIAAMVAVMAIVYVLVARVFFALGARSEMRRLP